MEMSTRSKDNGSTEQTAHKRKSSSPSHSSDDPSSSETSHPPVKKKKKPGAMSSTKDQCALRHGPFYYVKQPALTTDPVDVVPQDGRNDFYCWLCHREGQVLCCELCPRVYHAKCLKLPAEPEGDWFCPECEKITVAECIETQSKAMMMLTIEQLSYLLKFALQKMKQPGDHPRLSSRSPHAASTQRKTFNWTEPFQKPVSLDQHPDYSEYIFHPMDLCSLEKNIKKKTYGCTEAFLADVKWILHNCIIYNGGNHKLTTTAKVIVKICEHEMNEIEVCPECYLSACQKRDNWFCEPCSNPHPLVWAKLKGFPFWPAKALRDKDGQVDARFFGQHDRAWVPLNNCYLMSNDVPFSVKKTKSIFNSAMQEMDVYVENMRKKFGVFNYASFRTPYTPDNNYQMLPDPSDPSSLPPTPEKKEKIKLAFDMTTLPRIPLTRAVCSGVVACQRLLLSDMAPSPQSSPSSDQSPSLSDGEQEAPEKPLVKSGANQSSGSDDSMEYNTGSPALCGRGPTGSSVDGPKPRPSHGPAHQEKTPPTGSILNLNLDRSKAEMDLKELSESVQLKQEVVRVVRSPKRRVKSRFQLNLDKTIESCKAQLGIDELSVDVYKGRSDSEDSEKSESTDSDDASDEEQSTTDTGPRKDPHNLLTKEKGPEEEDGLKEGVVSGDSGAATVAVTKEKLSGESETTRATPGSPTSGEGPQRNLDKPPVDDSDSERELVIDLGEEKTGKDRRRNKKDMKESTAAKTEGKPLNPPTLSSQSSPVPSTPTPGPAHSSMPLPVTMVSFNTHSPATINLTSLPNASATAPTASSTSASSTPALKKQRPLLPRESVAVVQKAVVWNPTSKTTTSSQKWHMQKVQRQQQHVEANGSSSQSARYQTRQAAKAVQQKDVPVTSVALASLATLAAPAVVPAEDIPTASSEVAADIAKYTNKIMDAIKGTMSEIYNDLSKSSSGNTIAEIRRLRIEIEKLQWLHQQELSEMKHNLELTMAEMRQSLEQEKERLVAEVKKQAEQEKQQAVEETKKKQWCANCRKEAIFYCCWNTSYCDYPCQQAHWPEHMKSCTQSGNSPTAAPQQEPEPITELRNNGSAPTNADSAPLKDPSDSAPSDKNCETEKKSNANVAVTLSSPTLQG